MTTITAARAWRWCRGYGSGLRRGFDFAAPFATRDAIHHRFGGDACDDDGAL